MLMMLPLPWEKAPMLCHGGNHTMMQTAAAFSLLGHAPNGCSIALIAVAASAVGLFIGGTFPLAFELAAELTYPVPT